MIVILLLLLKLKYIRLRNQNNASYFALEWSQIMRDLIIGDP